MVAIARAAAGHSPKPKGSLDYIQSDIRHCRLDRVFDSVVSLFHVISYQTSNSAVIETFANAARHLVSEGLFLFDVWHGPAVLGERPSVRIKRVEDEATKLIRIAEPELNTRNSVVTVRYTILAESKRDGQTTTFSEEHHMRYFFPTEIELLASHTGFDIEKSEEFLTRREPTDSTWGVAYLLRKRV